MLTRIESVVRFVPDIAAAAGWYSRVLNAPVQYENDKYAFIRSGSQVMGFHPADSKCPGGVGGTTVYWDVPDLAKAVTLLVAKGAVLHRGPGVTSFGARVAMLMDRFGCTIGLTPATRIMIAEREDHLIGFAQLTLGSVHELAPSGNQSELLRLYVQEPFTAQGVGTRLLAAAENSAAAHGSSVLWLTPWAHNLRAIAFYARRGYADHGLTYFHFEGEKHENRLLAKTMGGA